MEIRWMKEKEIRDVILLLSEAFPVDTTEERVKPFLDSENRFLVAFDLEKPVGVVLVRMQYNFIENLRYYHLDNVCVKNEYQNRGIASSLLQEVERIAREEGIDYIDLTASNYRKIAQHVYLKNGYEIRDSLIFRRRISEKEF